jgi:uncharacterized protein (DUF697 family)
MEPRKPRVRKAVVRRATPAPCPPVQEETEFSYKGESTVTEHQTEPITPEYEHTATTQQAEPVSQETAGVDVASEMRRLKCDMTISKHVAASIGAGFIPVPIVDFALITGIQVDLLYRLCKIYEIKFSKEVARSVLASLVGAAVPGFQSTLFASGMKFIPGVGTAAALLATPTLSAATTYAVGRVFVQHLESGGTLLTFDAMKMREHFEMALGEGKWVVTTAARS